MYMHTPETQRASGPRAIRWVGGSYTDWYISKRASRDTVRGGKPQRNVAPHSCIMCMYIRHVCRQRIEFILSPPPLYPSVASRRSSIQIASLLGILNLWYARCALLILCHAYASWILQRSRKGQRDTAVFFKPPLFSSPGLNSLSRCASVSFSPFISSSLVSSQEINPLLARRSVTPGNITFLG